MARSICASLTGGRRWNVSWMLFGPRALPRMLHQLIAHRTRTKNCHCSLLSGWIIVSRKWKMRSRRQHPCHITIQIPIGLIGFCSESYGRSLIKIVAWCWHIWEAVTTINDAIDRSQSPEDSGTLWHCCDFGTRDSFLNHCSVYNIHSHIRDIFLAFPLLKFVFNKKFIVVALSQEDDLSLSFATSFSFSLEQAHNNSHRTTNSGLSFCETHMRPVSTGYYGVV